MKKNHTRKLQLRSDTLAQLSTGELGQVAGAAYTDSPRCVETSPRSFCICASKNICSINC